MASALNILGILADENTDYEKARSLYEEALPLLRDQDEPRRTAALLNNLALVSMHRKDVDAAEEFIAESLALYRQAGDSQGTAVALTTSADLFYRQGHLAASRALYEESLTIRRDLDDKQGIAETLEGLAGIGVSQGRPGQAATLLGAADALRAAIGFPVPPDQRPDYERHLGTARAVLTADEFDAHWVRGRAMSRRQAVEYALGEEEGRLAVANKGKDVP